MILGYRGQLIVGGFENYSCRLPRPLNLRRQSFTKTYSLGGVSAIAAKAAFSAVSMDLAVAAPGSELAATAAEKLTSLLVSIVTPSSRIMAPGPPRSMFGYSSIPHNGLADGDRERCLVPRSAYLIGGLIVATILAKAGFDHRVAVNGHAPRELVRCRRQMRMLRSRGVLRLSLKGYRWRPARPADQMECFSTATFTESALLLCPRLMLWPLFGLPFFVPSYEIPFERLSAIFYCEEPLPPPWFRLTYSWVLGVGFWGCNWPVAKLAICSGDR